MTLRDHLYKIKKSKLRLSTNLKIVIADEKLKEKEILFKGHKDQVGYLLSAYYMQEYLSNKVVIWESRLVLKTRYITLLIRER